MRISKLFFTMSTISMLPDYNSIYNIDFSLFFTWFFTILCLIYVIKEMVRGLVWLVKLRMHLGS